MQTAGSDTGSGSGGEWVAAEVTYSGGTPQTTVLTSSDGTSWTSTTVVPGEAFSGLAWGDGKWIAVSNVYSIGTATHILQSTDLHTWTQVATTPETLVAVGHTNGQWVAVGSWPAGVAVAGVDHATRAAYTSTNGTTWTQLQNVPDGPDNGANMRGLVSVAHGDQGWTAAGIDETTPASGAPPSYQLTTLTSADGTTWNQVGTGVAVGDGRTAIANGGGTWAESMYQTAGKGVLSTGPDGTSWSLVPNTPFATHPVTAIAYGGGTWVAVSGPVPSTDGSPPANPASTFFSSPDLKSWKRTSQDVNNVTAIAYGGAANGSTTPAAATGSPPCTRQALQDAFGHDPLDDMNVAIINSYDAPICADGWAAVHFPDQGMYNLAIFRASGSTWTSAGNDLSSTYPRDPIPADSQAYVERWHSLCTDPQFPKALHAYACPGQ